MNASSSNGHEAVVIGAGQAALAAEYHLARRGIDFTVLEASGRVGDVWRERYDSLLLYSLARYNALPGLQRKELVERHPRLDGLEFVAHLESPKSGRSLQVEVVRNVDVVDL